MKTKTFQIVWIIVLLFSFSLTAFAAETIAVVLKVKGTVALQKEDNKASGIKLTRGYRLENGDKLVTGKKGYAAIRFIDDASLVRIRANSTCIIRGKKEQNKVLKNVYLEVGTILARVTKQKGKFEISTPTSVASVKGTGWIADQKPLNIGGKTFYYGLEGIVEISNKHGKALLHEDETGEVEPEKAPTVRKTIKGEVPDFEQLETDEDLFEFEFENEAGQKKILQFKAAIKEEE